jgi:hypothetical protein
MGPIDQTGVVKDHKIQFELHHCIGLVEYQDSYVERSNQSPDEGDMTSPRSTRRVHRSDRCPLIPSQIEES